LTGTVIIVHLQYIYGLE